MLSTQNSSTQGKHDKPNLNHVQNRLIPKKEKEEETLTEGSNYKNILFFFVINEGEKVMTLSSRPSHLPSTGK